MDHEQIDHAADLGGYLSGRISGRTVRRSQVGEEVTPPLSATKLEVRGRWLLNNSIHTGQGIEICRIGRRIPFPNRKTCIEGSGQRHIHRVKRSDSTVGQYIPSPTPETCIERSGQRRIHRAKRSDSTAGRRVPYRTKRRMNRRFRKNCLPLRPVLRSSAPENLVCGAEN